MGTKLSDVDEFNHQPTDQINWNESRYIDFWDSAQRVGGWFRTGFRPNAKYAEMSAAVDLPDGRQAFMFGRPHVDENSYGAGGLEWHVDLPWQITRLDYHGEMMILENGWQLTDPKKAFTQAPRVQAEVSLTTKAFGLPSVMGFDQDHIDLIFLPGQADFHYQHLIHTTGNIKVGDQSWRVDGRGGKDHSWGPRNRHAKIYLRWLIASFNDDYGFMLVRGVGKTKKTRSGYVWENGVFHLVDDFEMENEYAGTPNYELKKATVKIKSGDKVWQATGTPQNWLPLRHVQKDEQGEKALLRIVKSPAEWTDSDGRKGEGMLEYHDLMVDGVPFGIKD